MTYYVVKASIPFVFYPIEYRCPSKVQADAVYEAWLSSFNVHSVEIIKVSTWLCFWRSKSIRANLPMHKLHKPEPLWARSLGLSQ